MEPLLEDTSQCGRAANAAGGGRRHRIYSLDLLRGTIMSIMAWDHIKDMVSDGLSEGKGSEMWSGPVAEYDNNVLIWFSRFVSHFCAPGFFWLMGMGMSMLAKSRSSKQGWTVWQIARHFLVRGSVIILAGRILNMFWLLPSVFDMAEGHQTHAHLNLPGPLVSRLFLGVFEVMQGLGEVMILAGCVVPPIVIKIRTNTKIAWLPNTVLIVCGIASFLFSFALIEQGQIDGKNPFETSATPAQLVMTAPFPRILARPNSTAQVLARFMLYPGMISTGFVAYPAIPWLGITLWGTAHGWSYREEPDKSHQRNGMLSIGFLVLFVLIRCAGGHFGNFRGSPRGEGSSVPFIAFFTICKYPPSLAYTSLTLGVNLLVLFAYGTAAMTDTIKECLQVKDGDCNDDTNVGFDDVRSIFDGATLAVGSYEGSIDFNGSLDVDVPVEDSPDGSMDNEGLGVMDPERQQNTRRCYSENGLVARARAMTVNALLTFGHVPFFYYCLHIATISMFGCITHAICGGLPLQYCPLVWILVLAILVKPCEKYNTFKSTQPADSLWRLF